MATTSTTSLETLTKVIGAKNLPYFYGLTGATISLVAAIAMAYLVAWYGVPPEAIAVVSITLIIGFWAYLLVAQMKTEKRSKQVCDILTSNAARTTVDASGENIILQRVGEMSVGPGQRAEMVMDSVPLSVDEMEGIRYAVERAKRQAILALPAPRRTHRDGAEVPIDVDTDFLRSTSR